MNLEEAMKALESRASAVVQDIESHRLDGLTIAEWKDKALAAESNLAALIKKVEASMQGEPAAQPEPVPQEPAPTLEGSA